MSMRHISRLNKRSTRCSPLWLSRPTSSSVFSQHNNVTRRNANTQSSANDSNNSNMKAAAAAAVSSGDLPDEADVVIIGGGSIGLSTLFHLTELGLTNVVLLEKDQLTAGTTWHSAGLLWRLRPSHIDVRLINHTRDLAKSLEARTGISTGWVENGGLFVANNQERLNEYERLCTLGKYFGIDSHVMTPADVTEAYPLLNTKDMYGALLSPGDGTIDPSGWVSALTKAAKLNVKALGGDPSAIVKEGQRVKSILVKQSEIGDILPRVSGVVTESGHMIRTTRVINCAGAWAPTIGQSLVYDDISSTSTSSEYTCPQVSVPLTAMHHAYVVTEPIPGVECMPNVRDHDSSVYLKLQGTSLQIGGYEPNPIFWENVDHNFAFSLFDLDWDVFATHIEGAVNRMPVLEQIGIRSTVCGPESFTPDHKALLGESPEVRGFFLGCGFNSAGIMLAGGCGKEIANWAVNGQPTMDMLSYDVKRFHKRSMSDPQWVRETSHESYAKNYAVVFPTDEPLSGRGLLSTRKSPLRDMLRDERGCVFQTRHGWERPGYFLPQNDKGNSSSNNTQIVTAPVLLYDYYGSYKYTPHANYTYKQLLEADNCFGWPQSHSIVAAEARATRNGAALFDQSYFGKLVLSDKQGGRLAQRAVDWICTSDFVSPEKGGGIGNTMYTAMCNPNGGVECDLTVSTIKDNVHDGPAFYVVTGGATASKDKAWVLRCLEELGMTGQVDVTDLTEDHTVLSLQGPQSRKVLERVLENSDALSNENFAFSTNQSLTTASGIGVLLLRVTFVGELGWEVHLNNDNAVAIYAEIKQAGIDVGVNVADAGYLAMDSLSVEKGFKHYHEDLSSEDTPMQAGIGFVCSKDKMEDNARDFCGKQALVAHKKRGLFRRLACFTTLDDTCGPLNGTEAIYRNGECIGFVQRAAYGHSVGANVGYGYVVNNPGGDRFKDQGCGVRAEKVTLDWLKQGEYELELLGQKRVPATFHSKCVYDPTNARVRG